jgi:hypothetical protein
MDRRTASHRSYIIPPARLAPHLDEPGAQGATGGADGGRTTPPPLPPAPSKERPAWARRLRATAARWLAGYAVVSSVLAALGLWTGSVLDREPAVHVVAVFLVVGYCALWFWGAYLVVIYPVRLYFRLEETGVRGWRWALVPILALHPLVILARLCEWLRLGLVWFTDLFSYEVDYKYLGTGPDGTKHYRCKPYIRALRGIHRR